MYKKIIIQTTIKILTGLHIGAGGSFSPIGAVDSPVIRDKRTQHPIIPGSSLKGKLRSLLSRSLKGDIVEHDGDPEQVLRLFGSSAPVRKSRLQFSDAFVSNLDVFSEIGLTEIKFENAIDRGTCESTPRQIERVLSGVEFEAVIVYEAEDDNQIEEDMQNLAKCMKLLQFDYLGGHGTRGSGRISFTKIDIRDIDGKEITDIKACFEDVKKYELLPL